MNTPYLAQIRAAGDHAQERTALVCRPTTTKGRTWAVWISADGVAAHSLTEAVLSHARPVENYAPHRAAKKLLRAGRRLGISTQAKKLLMEVLDL